MQVPLCGTLWTDLLCMHSNCTLTPTQKPCAISISSTIICSKIFLSCLFFLILHSHISSIVSHPFTNPSSPTGSSPISLSLFCQMVYSSTMKFSKNMVTFYQTTWHNIQKTVDFIISFILLYPPLPKYYIKQLHFAQSFT